jgi:uncharacterized Tic20 family protein
MQQDPNYGRHEEETGGYRAWGDDGLRTEPVPSGSMSAADERTWSMLAHLSVLVNLFTGFGGILAALVIWLVFRERSGRVAFHALQSLWYQVAWAVILTVGWTITVVLMFVLVGFLLVPVMLILSLVPFVHQVYAAIKVNNGMDYRYPIVADWVDGARRLS